MQKSSEQPAQPLTYGAKLSEQAKVKVELSGDWYTRDKPKDIFENQSARTKLDPAVTGEIPNAGTYNIMPVVNLKKVIVDGVEFPSNYIIWFNH